MSFSKDQHMMMFPAEKQRELNCTKCLNHGIILPLKGHTGICPFMNCTCYDCNLMSHQDLIKPSKRCRIDKSHYNVGPPCMDSGGSWERPPPGGTYGGSLAGGGGHEADSTEAHIPWRCPDPPTRPMGRGQHAAPGFDGRQMLQVGPPARLPCWGLLEDPGHPGSYAPYTSFPGPPMSPGPFGTYNMRPPMFVVFQPGAAGPPPPGYPGSGYPGSGYPGSGHPASGSRHPGSKRSGSGSGHPGSGQPGSRHSGSGHPGSRHPGSGSGHPGSRHPGSGHPGSRHPGSGHPGSRHPGPGHPAGVMHPWMPQDRKQPKPRQPSREEEDGRCSPDSAGNISCPSQREI